MDKSLKFFFSFLTVTTILAAVLVSRTSEAYWGYILAFIYMPLPAVSAFLSHVLIEKQSARSFLSKYVSVTWKSYFQSLKLAALVAAVFVVIYLVATFVLGNLLQVPGVGHLVSNSADLFRALLEKVPPDVAQQTVMPSLPPLSLLIIGGLISAVFAGATINMLFALGEEIGWRSYLYEKLPQTPMVQIVGIGIVWGLWHAPIIIQGYNYPGYPVIGIFSMCLLTISLAYIEYNLRKKTGTVFAAAIVHGIFNGAAGLLTILAAQNIPVIGGTTGLVTVGSMFLAGYLVFTYLGVAKNEGEYITK